MITSKMTPLPGSAGHTTGPHRHKPMKAMRFILAVLTFALLACPQAGAEIIKLPKAEKKISIYELGDAGLENLRSVGRGYGQKICSGKEITGKEDIKGKAWSRIKGNCGRFTFGLQSNFNDDPNEIFSLCIGAALDGCQQQLGIEPPCHDLSSCQALLGVPD